MGRCDTVLLDLDGTLLDTLEDLADSLNHVLRKYGCPECPVGDVRRFVGRGLRNLMAQALEGGETHPRFEEMFAEFRPYYTAHCQDKTRPYPGIPELLAALQQRGYRAAVVSNKSETAARALIGKYFSLPTVGQRDGMRPKPEPDMLDEALRILGSSRDRAVCVGDSEVDFAMAGKAGLPCILVTWGLRDRDTLEALHPAALADTPDAVLEKLETL